MHTIVRILLMFQSHHVSFNIFMGSFLYALRTCFMLYIDNLQGYLTNIKTNYIIMSYLVNLRYMDHYLPSCIDVVITLLLVHNSFYISRLNSTKCFCLPSHNLLMFTYICVSFIKIIFQLSTCLQGMRPLLNFVVLFINREQQQVIHIFYKRLPPPPFQLT